jgi:hypothetical protein
MNKTLSEPKTCDLSMNESVTAGSGGPFVHGAIGLRKLRRPIRPWSNGPPEVAQSHFCWTNWPPEAEKRILPIANRNNRFNMAVLTFALCVDTTLCRNFPCAHFQFLVCKVDLPMNEWVAGAFTAESTMGEMMVLGG